MSSTMKQSRPWKPGMERVTRQALGSSTKAEAVNVSVPELLMSDGYSYQGLTVVISGEKLTTKQIIEVLPFINDHHDGKLSHGELITKINKRIGAESDWDTGSSK